MASSIRPPMKEYKGGDFKYAHIKLDGHFTCVKKAENGRVTFLSKLGTHLDLSWMPSAAGFITRCPPGTWFGELWYPKMPASYIKTAIKNKDKYLTLSVFAAEHLPAGAGLEVIADHCIKYGLDFVPYYSDEGYHTYRLGTIKDGLPKQGEGYVFKEGNLIGWHRQKWMKTIDLIVHDVKEGNGKNAGLISSLICKTSEGQIVANVSGLTEQEMIEVSTESPIGKVVEVKYQYVGSKGRLRHPNFIRFREDKLPEECSRTQDSDL